MGRVETAVQHQAFGVHPNAVFFKFFSYFRSALLVCFPFHLIDKVVVLHAHILVGDISFDGNAVFTNIYRGVGGKFRHRNNRVVVLCVVFVSFAAMVYGNRGRKGRKSFEIGVE